ncbi:alpha/beta fold hydrolase [Demequina zhanjiangensis]|uniref:Alpha/beta fold hydrolase n=1 Tax=Demequina zhanjiangensis TaxID=3051659 RepID=A0ABT8G4E6_9MICO|nr:alpha/beta fold hydrolase [Demequina sp. SYSU T00b26]MDN4473993.1 alpha/beta fold hydrolase [Demequina sp. SYSU T00b26]
MGGGRYTFGDCELDVAGYTLARGGTQVSVEPRVFDLLAHLVTHRDRVVTKEELLDTLWGTRFVSEAALTTALRSARLAVGDSGSAQRVIRTVHGRGYQFVASVATQTPQAEVSIPHAPPSPGAQRVRFCHAEDGVRIAYAEVGQGPVLMKAANWITHLDLEWGSAVWSHWLYGLADGRRLIRYDERGCGMSDQDVPSSTFEDWVSDLETVVDAAGLDRFPLLGVSQGGAVALAYAVRHPERVTHLVLAGAYARGRMVRARDDGERAEAVLDLDLARVGWERDDPSFMRVFASQFLPGGTLDDWDDFTRFQKRTCSGANAVRFLEEFGSIDVRDLLPQVSCPTLILHSRDDRRVPVSEARDLAALIPDSRLVLLDSASHLIGAAEPAWPEFLSHIDAFLAS